MRNRHSIRRHLPADTFIPLARLNRSPGTKINLADVTDLRQRGLTLAVLEQRMRALEQVHAPIFGPSGSQFSVRTGGVGLDVIVFGRNFDLGVLTASFLNITTSVRVAANTKSALPTQATVTVPAGVTGTCLVTLTNPFGSGISLDTFNVI